MSQKIRIKLKSYDHNLVDKSAEKIVKTVKSFLPLTEQPLLIKKQENSLNCPHTKDCLIFTAPLQIPLTLL